MKSYGKSLQMIYKETITENFDILRTFLLCLIEEPNHLGICLWSWQPFPLYIDSDNRNVWISIDLTIIINKIMHIFVILIRIKQGS